MIELTYFLEEHVDKTAYQIIQFHPGGPWQIVDGDELIGKMEKLHGLWNLQCVGSVPEGLITGIAKLIDGQHFQKLPADIKKHWEQEVQKVIIQTDARYLVVCKEGIDFERFEKVFRTFIAELIRDEWQICFAVYNSQMSADFEVTVN